LGNLLRYALIKNPDVEFCGYSITHPSEHTVNMRLQTTGLGTNSVLAQGLNSVLFMADVSERKFKEALDKKLSESKQKKKNKATRE
jgi:DNA-directed RNA polymerase I and III subunit RPAC2